MFAKKHSKGHLGAAILAVAGIVALGVRTIHRLLSKPERDAAGLSAKDRFDLYADLEEARERDRAKRNGQVRATEAS
jgi:hypothetical protein